MLEASVVEAVAADGVLNTIHLVGDTTAVHDARWLLASDVMDSTIGARLNQAMQGRSIVTITFDSAHERYILQAEHVPEARRPALLNIERRFWLYEAFRRTGALVRAPQGLHYQKTSKRHSAAFLRAANVLEDGPNISALAFWLLGVVAGKAIERIIVDTSGIAAVAVAAGHEAVRRELLKRVPTVETHRSYDGLESLRISRPNQTLVLVSASTSDGLVERLIQNDADEGNIVTLFYLGKRSSRGQILCDLRAQPDIGFVGIEHIESYDKAGCELCHKGSVPVEIAGDQFMLEPPRIEEVRLAREDLPAVRSSRMLLSSR